MLGKPLQSDKLTSSMSRLSYARLLVELNLMDDLPYSIQVLLPNGAILTQPVVYETLSKFCKHCKVLSHTTAACSSKSRPSNQGHQGISDNELRSRGINSMTNIVVGNNGNHQSDQQTLDPMQAEAEAVTDGWEVVKGKKPNCKFSRPRETTMTDVPQSVACPMDVRLRGACDETSNGLTTSSGGGEGISTGLIRTGEKACEGTSAGFIFRNGEKVCDKIIQIAAPSVVATRRSTRKLGGSGRRPPTSPAC